MQNNLCEGPGAVTALPSDVKACWGCLGQVIKAWQPGDAGSLGKGTLGHRCLDLCAIGESLENLCGKWVT